MSHTVFKSTIDAVAWHLRVNFSALCSFIAPPAPEERLLAFALPSLLLLWCTLLPALMHTIAACTVTGSCRVSSLPCSPGCCCCSPGCCCCCYGANSLQLRCKLLPALMHTTLLGGSPRPDPPAVITEHSPRKRDCRQQTERFPETTSLHPCNASCRCALRYRLIS